MNTKTEDVSEIVLELRAIRAAVESAARMPAELLDKSQVGTLTGLGESTLDRYRAAGLFGPADIRINHALRWRRAEVLAWIAHPAPSGELMDRKTWTSIWAELQKRNAKN